MNLQIMKLIIMRHGEAEQWAESDEQRRLTQYGHDEVASAAAQLKTRFPTIDAIIASPFVRAQQTVEIVEAGYSMNHSTSLHLTPESTPEQMLELLDTNIDDTLLLVSHQPLVSLSIEFFTSERVSMGTANIALVEMPLPGYLQGELKWVI